MDKKDELIRELIAATEAAYKDAIYWLYENSGLPPGELDSYDQVEAVMAKAKNMGY